MSVFYGPGAGTVDSPLELTESEPDASGGSDEFPSDSDHSSEGPAAAAAAGSDSDQDLFHYPPRKPTAEEQKEEKEVAKFMSEYRRQPGESRKQRRERFGGGLGEEAAELRNQDKIERRAKYPKGPVGDEMFEEEEERSERAFWADAMGLGSDSEEPLKKVRPREEDDEDDEGGGRGVAT